MPRPVAYIGRPGVSPVTATLIAQEVIRPRDRILDVGCGSGTEALLLADWGFRKIEAIDHDPAQIRVARGRATRRGLAKRVRFHRMDAVELPQRFRPRTFDVVLHTLVANNLSEEAVEPHFDAIRRVMKKDGVLVVVERVHNRFADAAPDTLAPLPGLDAHFFLSAGVGTNIPERAAVSRDPGHARVMVWLARPRV